MGLLNFKDIETNPLLQTGLGILANNTGHYGQFAPAFGRGTQQGLQQAQSFRQAQQDDLLRKQHLDMQKARFAQEQEAIAAEKNRQEQKRETFESIGAQYGIDPNILDNFPKVGEDLINNKLIPKQQKIGFTPSGVAYDENNPQLKLGENYAKPDTASTPANIQEYNFAKEQGYGGSFLDFQLAQKKAGAVSTTINNKLDLKTGEGLAKEVGPMVAASKAAAEGANNTLDITKTIDNAIASKKLISGPFANGRIKLLQVGQVLGINGADDNEILANTRSAIQGLSKITLEGRSALKGQGQISDYEGRLLAKATSGDISELTIPELKVISSAANRVAKAQQEIHQRNMKVMRSKPELSGVADFYDVPSLSNSDSGADNDALSNFSVQAPNGKTYKFKSQHELNNFKLKAGIR